MMAAWMLYTLLVTLLLVAAGVAAERMARALRAPTRTSWVLVTVAAMSLSVASLYERRVMPATAGAAAASVDSSTVSPPALGTSHGEAAPALTLERAHPIRVNGLAARTRRLLNAAVLRLDQSRWRRYDEALAVTCVSLATVGLLVVLLSFARLYHVSTKLTTSEVDGMPVLLSKDMGPAVLGFLRLHVVVPRWIVTLPADARRTILLHEQEHAAAHDPMWVLLGVVALALQPWNLPLWIAVARLRFALEADCDARVLQRSRCGAHRYGMLLLQVSEHELMGRTSSRMPVTAFVDSTSHLERRVRRMTDRQPRLRSLSTAAALVATMLCIGITSSVRVLDARAMDADYQKTPPEPSPALVADAAKSGNADSPSVVIPRWQVTLPDVANSERQMPRADTRVVARAVDRRDSPVVQMAWIGPHDAFTPETLLVAPSNTNWPMRARVITTATDGMSYATVTDTLGRLLPTADTLEVNGPIRLILPDARFELRVESLYGDLSLTSSPVPAWDGQGGHLVSLVLSRTLHARREAVGARVLLGGKEPVFVKQQRVP